MLTTAGGLLAHVRVGFSDSVVYLAVNTMPDTEYFDEGDDGPLKPWIVLAQPLRGTPRPLLFVIGVAPPFLSFVVTGLHFGWPMLTMEFALPMYPLDEFLVAWVLFAASCLLFTVPAFLELKRQYREYFETVEWDGHDAD